MLGLRSTLQGPGCTSRCQAPAPRRFSPSLVRRDVKSAVALPMPVHQMDETQRAELAAETGYRSIGKELPDDVTLSKIIKSMPPEVFEIDHSKSWRAVLISVCSFAASLYLISISPWYLLPFAWALSGTAFTGWFVIGHDCGHRSFHKNNLVEDIVGTLMLAPLIYPFEPWRIKHNHHHAHTNKLVEDTAWHPMTEDSLKNFEENKLVGNIFKVFLGTPLKLWASVGHWAIWHFDLSKYKPKEHPRVITSLAAVAAFALIALPALVYYTGWFGLVKYWLMPWLGYHFWMSTFTIIHHTAPHIPFKPAEEWNAAKAQLSGTVHCDFPGWVEFLTHDISWHVPHHVSTKIPWYNLRKATASLRQNWGEYMTECTFNWRVVKNVITHCHVYDKDVNYRPFDSAKEEPYLKFQRAVLPENM
ncbi:chloroplast w6 desaturase [Dunaliella salina]|uniref:Chloroplast w6 desaturase n=1 Tax=Dunaliella salina TaxID=3046 RepID=A0ABQ7G1G6_DUNSA|nr:chloroplast w6 desaturase [Dunaliella salina]|eukprot:KAF5828427.1 chloroplast w6 desaturase [Dunaliella salina]